METMIVILASRDRISMKRGTGDVSVQLKVVLNRFGALKLMITRGGLDMSWLAIVAVAALVIYLLIRLFAGGGG